eukprot:2752152-Rhodomonas_salina.1
MPCAVLTRLMVLYDVLYDVSREMMLCDVRVYHYSKRHIPVLEAAFFSTELGMALLGGQATVRVTNEVYSTAQAHARQCPVLVCACAATDVRYGAGGTGTYRQRAMLLLLLDTNIQYDATGAGTVCCLLSAVYCVLCTVYCALCTAYCVLCTECFALRSAMVLPGGTVTVY